MFLLALSLMTGQHILLSYPIVCSILVGQYVLLITFCPENRISDSPGSLFFAVYHYSIWGLHKLTFQSNRSYLHLAGGEVSYREAHSKHILVGPRLE